MSENPKANATYRRRSWLAGASVGSCDFDVGSQLVFAACVPPKAKKRNRNVPGDTCMSNRVVRHWD